MSGWTFSRLAALTVALVSALQPTVGTAAEPKVLNIYNWSDYIADDTLKNFEKETGIKVVYDNYDNNEILHAKLVAGKTGYDIVVPSAHFAKMQIEAGLFRPLDRAALKNWGNLDPALLEQLAKVDPGNKYLVNWLWGFVTVGINTGKVKAALGDLPMPANPWALLFDAKYSSKLKGCGISVLDSASEVLPVAMGYAGKPAYSRDPKDYDAAAKVLAAARPNVTRFSSSGYINDMVAGQICLVMGYSGDINIGCRRWRTGAAPTAGGSWRARPPAVLPGFQRAGSPRNAGSDEAGDVGLAGGADVMLAAVVAVAGGAHAALARPAQVQLVPMCLARHRPSSLAMPPLGRPVCLPGQGIHCAATRHPPALDAHPRRRSQRTRRRPACAWPAPSATCCCARPSRHTAPTCTARAAVAS